MAKTKTIYTCQKCGYESGKWLGKCPDCSEWNSFVEETQSKSQTPFFELKTETATPLSEITSHTEDRIQTGIPEMDRVLGGGYVPGSLTLLGGDPGIGKSTLILQTLDKLSAQGIKVLYATGEEAANQIKMRAKRLEVKSDILVIAENSLERIIAQVTKHKPAILVVDSIQTVNLSDIESAPGSLSQVRECAGKLLYLSKSTGVATTIIGHVTKEGSLAGPRVLEHMVDTVLYFEGDSHQHYRILRTIKNRYGSTNEIGVFEMSQLGLIQVDNPSSLFLSEREKPIPGSAITASLEGRRPILVEIQALVSSSVLANPRRTTLGIDSTRVSMIIAVIEKILGLDIYTQDVYLNAAGGFKVHEPAADLAIAASLISSFKNQPLRPDILILGEIGLSGEIRGLNTIEIRLTEAAKLGFKKCILPKSKKKLISSSHLEISYVGSLQEAVEELELF